MVMLAYAAVIVVGCIIVYSACRAVDHFFAVREKGVEAVYTAGLIEEAGDQIEWLTQDMLKNMNDTVQSWYKGES